MTTLRLVSSAPDWYRTAAERAAEDLATYTNRLRLAAASIRTNTVGTALHRLKAWRLYGLERHPGRWPDGRFYLLDRNYQPWRQHHIAFTPIGLTRIGIVLAPDQDFVPLQTDCFCLLPRRRLGEYAELVGRLAAFFKDETCRDGA